MSVFLSGRRIECAGWRFVGERLDRVRGRERPEKIAQSERIIPAKLPSRRTGFVDRHAGKPCGECNRAPRPSVQESMSETVSKPRVLVADDERVIADTLVMILNQSGFEARAVYSGEKAVELASVFKPDMIISDVIMADLNGIDAAIRIRALFPEAKILLFSGQAATADLLEKARAQGYEFEILAKPVHPQDLLTRLRG
jgi:CheY-like chemotaxis protein